jgi:sarcosine oxidase
MDRRGFLRTIGVGVGGLAASGGVGRSLLNPGTLAAGGVPAVRSGRSPDVVVVGAGAFGGWTALRLREAGLRVTLVDMYGPGNARSTSGDETRGVRTGYRTREVWSAWASRAIEAWKDFDFGWGRELGVKLFHTTGDLALRAPDSPFIQETVPTWERLGIRHEVLDGEEVARRWPQLRPLEGEVGLYEPEAGVARSRLACEVVAEVFRRLGGETRTVRAVPGEGSGDRLRNLSLDGGEALHADRFVFALGPWFPKAFPGLMGDRMTLPMGYVCYYGTPPGDPRFTAPNLPSFNLPTATGWPDLPAGSRGFRIRASGGPAGDPDTSDRWVPEASLDVTRELLTERFPAMAEAPLLETRACHYEFSFTRDWLIDRHPQWENVWFAGEGNAESFKFGPILGGFIAGRVLDDDPHPELADRFRWDSDPPAGTAWG